MPVEINDDALLQRELHWRSRPGDRRRPSGSNAITAIGLVLTLVQWGITGVVLGPLMAGPPAGGMIDPRAIVFLAVYAVELGIAVAVATRVWIAIGPGARAVLRPFGVLGPWPMIAITFFVAVYIVAIVAAPFLPRTPAAATSGRNWQLLDTGRLGVTYEEAVQRCEQTGARVPSRDDLSAFDPSFPRGTEVWLEQPAGADYLLTFTHEGRFARQNPRPGVISRESVVCFRP